MLLHAPSHCRHINAAAKRESGNVIVTVCFLLFFLLAFIGITLDFGHLFIVKTELQTAMDSCALAAAQELNGESTALTRASNAGMTSANLNSVNLQSATWDGQGKLVTMEITYKDAGYISTTVPANARYVECQHTQPQVRMWLLHAMGAYSGNASAFPSAQPVAARAVATLAPAQSTCPVPLALKPKPGQAAPNYGFAIGEWVTLLNAQNASAGGQIGWANLDGTNSASETESELRGRCGTKVGDTLGTPGVQSTVADVWNARFGIYKNNSGPGIDHPDFTGYGYTATSWPGQANAYNDFVSKRQSFANCAISGTKVKGANSCESITGLSLNGGFSTLATPGELNLFGVNRRLVTVPIVDNLMHVTNYACMLLLQPIPIPMADVKLEYRGNAAVPGSPCTGNGLPGGTLGPRVPVLVR